jgi:hypothetical protein
MKISKESLLFDLRAQHYRMTVENKHEVYKKEGSPIQIAIKGRILLIEDKNGETILETSFDSED